MVTDLFSDSSRCWLSSPWVICRAVLVISVIGYVAGFTLLRMYRLEWLTTVWEWFSLMFWWVMLPVWAAGFVQGLRINWRKAGWAVMEGGLALVLTIVFSVGLLNYAYNHERQKMERAIAHLPSR